ncbi:hypothetical protein M9458_021800, partial [Cirrhinus mrigala]
MAKNVAKGFSESFRRNGSDTQDGGSPATGGPSGRDADRGSQPGGLRSMCLSRMSRSSLRKDFRRAYLE